MSTSLTYDTAALIRAESDDDFVWSLHEAALDAGMHITVPAGVLAEAWTNDSHTRLSLLLKGCEIEPLGEARSRAVGVLCSRSGSGDIVDASVVLGAGIRGDAIVTSERAAIEALGDVLGLPNRIIEI